MATMLSCSNTHRLIIVILLISLALISTVIGTDTQFRERKWARKSRRINCAIYVFAPRCRGVSAKRSSPPLYPASLPEAKDVPEVYQIFQKSPQKPEEDSLSPLPGLILPNAYSYDKHRPSKLQRLQQLQEEQQEAQQQLQQHPMLRSVLQLLLDSSERQTEADTSKSQWRRNLLQEISRKRRQIPLGSEVYSNGDRQQL